VAVLVPGNRERSIPDFPDASGSGSEDTGAMSSWLSVSLRASLINVRSLTGGNSLSCVSLLDYLPAARRANISLGPPVKMERN